MDRFGATEATGRNVLTCRSESRQDFRLVGIAIETLREFRYWFRGLQVFL